MANSGWAWYLFGAPAIWVANRRGVAVMLNYRGELAREFFASSFPTVSRGLRSFDDLIVPTAFLKEMFAGYGESASIVPNIVDLNPFRPAVEATPDLHVVVTRNLERIYDNASALRALALPRREVPNATLTVNVEGSERRDLEVLTRELGISRAVRFAGRLPREGVAELLRHARALLNPSTSDNSPNFLIEAMASEVPIVSTDVRGVSQLCQDGRNAVLVPPRSPGAMAEALLRVHREPDLRARLIREGLERAADFGWDRVWVALETIYRRALDRRGGRRRR